VSFETLQLLTGPGAFSAAEMLAYDVKALGRATLVGEPTGGGANSVDLIPVGSHLEICIPTSRAVNPLTGSNGEGCGVLPDVSVPEEQAPATAVDLARTAAKGHAHAKEVAVEIATGRMEASLAQAKRLFGAGEDLDALEALELDPADRNVAKKIERLEKERRETDRCHEVPRHDE